MCMWMRWAAVAAVALVAACGQPKPKVDEAILSDIPLQEKQGMLNARNDMDRAAEEHTLAQSRLATAKEDVDLAKGTRDEARIEARQDQTRLEVADKNKDADAIRDAKERLRVSDMAVSGANARIAWLEQRQKACQAAVSVADARQHLANARYELEKARLAQREHRRPNQDFRVSQFEQEVADQQQKWQAAEGEFDAQRAQATRLRDIYAQQAQRYNQLRTQVPGPEPAIILPAPQETMRAKAPGPSAM